MVTASHDRIVTVYDLDAQTLLKQIQAHNQGSVNTVKYWGASSNTFITGGNDGTVRLFDLR